MRLKSFQNLHNAFHQHFGSPTPTIVNVFLSDGAKIYNILCIMHPNNKDKN